MFYSLSDHPYFCILFFVSFTERGGSFYFSARSNIMNLSGSQNLDLLRMLNMKCF